MKRTVSILVAALLVTTKPIAQISGAAGQTNTNAKNKAVVFGPSLPVGTFSNTHIAGMSLTFLWGPHHFGLMKEVRDKRLGFVANGGIDYFFGRKETVAAVPYRYGGYLYIHAFGGGIYHYSRKASFILAAGPTLGIYKTSSHVGLGVNLSNCYNLADNIGIRPGLSYSKHKNAAPLWTAGLLVEYSF
jgi:hypothetical protein